MNIEQRLRIDLADRADDIADTPADLVGGVVAGLRRQQRRRATALAAVVCAAVVAVAVPLTTGGTDVRGGTADERRTAELAGFQPYPLTPRGNLSDDPDYVSGLLERRWFPSHDTPNPPVDTRQVLFAGEVPGGIQALVTGWLDGARTGLWLNGPAGAAPEDLEASGEPFPVGDDEPLSYVYTENGEGALVVLGRPGDTVEVSAGREITADGSLVQAPYVEVGGPDGVAVVDAASLRLSTFTVRVSRDGRVVHEGPSAGAAVGGGPGEIDLDKALEGATGMPDHVLVTQLAAGVLEELDLTADEAEVAVLWGGPIGNHNRPEATAALLTVRLPSGATVLLGGYAADATQGQEAGTIIGPCVKEFLPVGTDATAAAMRCDLYDSRNGAGQGSQLVVVPPAGTRALRLNGGSGAVLDTPAVSGPAWVGPAPDGLASATAVGADGRVLADIPLGTVENLHD